RAAVAALVEQREEAPRGLGGRHGRAGDRGLHLGQQARDVRAGEEVTFEAVVDHAPEPRLLLAATLGGELARRREPRPVVLDDRPDAVDPLALEAADGQVRRVTPPNEPADGLGRMNAPDAVASRGMRVLSPRMLPPESALDGSTASTATRFPSPIRWSPSASMNVLLPTPGTPLTPTRTAPPVCGRRSPSSRWAASS